MKINHLAIWTYDIELLRQFYTRYFHCTAGAKYENQNKGFSSYFLSFSDGETRLELMNVPQISGETSQGKPLAGFAHMAISTGSREEVDKLTEQLRADGYRVLSEPRTTGDGYYESAVADPEGNYVEITE